MIKNIFKKYKIFIFLGLILIIIIFLKIRASNQKNLPTTPLIPPTVYIAPTPTPDPLLINKFWQDLINTPKESLLEKLGPAEKTVITNNRTVLTYPSDTENWPTQVFLSIDKNSVSFIKRFFPSKEETYLRFIEKYGQYDKKYFGEQSPSGFDIYIFEKTGIAIVASKDSDVILQVWYFSPNNTENLLLIENKNLKETQPKVF